MLYAVGSAVVGDFVLVSGTASFDEETSVAEFLAQGLVTTQYKDENGRRRMAFTRVLSSSLLLDHDRSRPAWREIPVDLGSAARTDLKLEVLLPEDEPGYQLVGRSEVDVAFAGNRLVRTGRLSGSKLTFDETLQSLGGELPASELNTEKAKLSRVTSSVPVLVAPKDAARSWAYGKPEFLKRIEPIEVAYSRAIAKDPKNPKSYTNRANFRSGTANLKGALADYDKAVELQRDAETLFARAAVKNELIGPAAALADFRAAFDMSPSTSTALALAQVLGTWARATRGSRYSTNSMITGRIISGSYKLAPRSLHCRGAGKKG